MAINSFAPSQPRHYTFEHHLLNVCKHPTVHCYISDRKTGLEYFPNENWSYISASSNEVTFLRICCLTSECWMAENMILIISINLIHLTVPNIWVICILSSVYTNILTIIGLLQIIAQENQHYEEIILAISTNYTNK